MAVIAVDAWRDVKTSIVAVHGKDEKPIRRYAFQPVAETIKGYEKNQDLNAEKINEQTYCSRQWHSKKNLQKNCYIYIFFSYHF